MVTLLRQRCSQHNAGIIGSDLLNDRMFQIKMTERKICGFLSLQRENRVRREVKGRFECFECLHVQYEYSNQHKFRPYSRKLRERNLASVVSVWRKYFTGGLGKCPQEAGRTGFWTENKLFGNVRPELRDPIPTRTKSSPSHQPPWVHLNSSKLWWCNYFYW